MSTLSIQNTIGEAVVKYPALSRLFEATRIDYCCGGKRTLAEVCQERNLDPQAFLAELEAAAAACNDDAELELSVMSLTELADHIEATHHAFLREEFPRLHMLTGRVAQVHGGDDPRLTEVRDTCLALAGELASHMMKEEQVLFPMIRQLEASEALPAFHCGSIANPIRQMELEHHGAGDALEKLRTLTDDYTPPTWACNTYRAMLDALAHLERDMHVHVHKEDNVLYPRALRREAELAKGMPA